MKLLYIVLAHNDPVHLARLARTLIQASSDAHAIIHFDGNARPDDYEALASEIAEDERIILTRDRVKCRWGDYSLVDAVLRSLRQIEADGISYDYALLLSGACLPCRPIKQLERFLDENRGKEFIECNGPDWVVAGLRKERYIYWSPFPPKPGGNDWSRVFRKLQSRLGIRRKPPSALTIRFGSQWWALSADTCKLILNFLSSNKSVERFFRGTYIPDEMMFQTLVYHVADESNISNYNLTHYKFSRRGKPLVYYDDHGNYPFNLDKFFCRKVSSEARDLRESGLTCALSDDDGSDLATIGSQNDDYEQKTALQAEACRAGQIFYKNQFSDQEGQALSAQKKPYIFLVGYDLERLRALSTALAKRGLLTVGQCFAPGKMDFGGGQKHLAGLDCAHIKIRDMHPELYLARMLERLPSPAVFPWCLGDSERVLRAVRQDSRALVISLLSDDDIAAFLTSSSPDESRRLRALGVDPSSGKRMRSLSRQLHLRGLVASGDPELLERSPEDDRVLLLPASRSGGHRTDWNSANAALEVWIGQSPFRMQPWFSELVAGIKAQTHNSAE